MQPITSLSLEGEHLPVRVKSQENPSKNKVLASFPQMLNRELVNTVPAIIRGYTVPSYLAHVVRQETELSWGAVTSASRSMVHVAARHAIALHLCKDLRYPWTYYAIGDLLNRDHATVMTSEHSAEALLDFSTTKKGRLVRDVYYTLKATARHANETPPIPLEQWRVSEANRLWRDGLNELQIAAQLDCGWSAVRRYLRRAEVV